MSTTPDSRALGRTLTGLLLIAAPTLFLLGAIVTPDSDRDNKVTELTRIAAHKSTYLLGGLLFLLGGVALIGAGVGLTHLFAGHRLGQVAGVLFTLGGAATVGFYAFTTVEYEMVNQSGLDRAQMARLVDKASNAGSGLPIVVVFLLGVVIGAIVLAIAVWRSRLAPRWVALVLAVSGPLSFAANGKAFGIVSTVVVLMGFGSLGLHTLRMPRARDPEKMASSPQYASS
jgi:hypothetical protein